ADLVCGRQYQDGRVPRAPHATGDLLTAHVGKSEVEDHEVGLGLTDRGESSHAGVVGQDLETGLFEFASEDPQDVDVVFDDQDSLGCHGHSSSMSNMTSCSRARSS